MQNWDNARLDIRQISPRDWARFGTEAIAYIRPVIMNGASVVAIHAADGTPIGAAPDARLAMAAIREHEMEPMLLH